MLEEFRTKYQRQIILVLAGLALLALTGLAAGLTQPEFRAPEHYIIAQPETDETGSDTASAVQPQTQNATPVVILLIALLILVVGLVSKEGRKRLIWTAIYIGFLMYIAYTFSNKVLIDLPENMITLPAPGDMTPVPVVDATEVAYEAPPSSPLVSYLISLGLIGALVVGGWMAWIWLRPPALAPLDEIAQVAKQALDDLESGRDWQDAVVSAYVKMGTVVGRQRGLNRPEGMTASEFAQRLERAGLPADPVRRLTRLFESVRYGGRTSNPDQVYEAASCLSAIVEACRSES